jgi:mono/diheme cytochrome c family protein
MSAALTTTLVVVGCSDDDEGGTPPGSDAGKDGGVVTDSAVPGDSGPMAGDVERGKYLIEHVGVCGDCHTPRKADGSFDTARLLAGVDCFIDVDPVDPDVGCLSSRNLTNDATGLKNRTDEEIKAMFLEGKRPVGSGDEPTALYPVMPYWVLGNMTDEDADSIVAYLRTVPAVENRVTPAQMPFLIDEPAPRFPEAKIPMPRDDYTDQEAALRGRYLAGNVGICMECHMGRDDMGLPLVDMAFAGGGVFHRDELGLPPVFPEIIYSSNITPHATGIQGWSVQNVVDALKKGEDFNQGGAPLCPPMPAGPMAAYGGLTDQDAADIGHYLLSIPPTENAIPADCNLSDGNEDGGTADGG